jgi:hypothetical protein
MLTDVANCGSYASSFGTYPSMYSGSYCGTTNCNAPPSSSSSPAPVTTAAPAGSGAASDDSGSQCYLETALYPGATTQCDNGVHTCASGYHCSLVTDGTCSNANCPACALNPAGSTYWGCYSAAPATKSAFAALALMAAVAAAML